MNLFSFVIFLIGLFLIFWNGLLIRAGPFVLEIKRFNKFLSKKRSHLFYENCYEILNMQLNDIQLEIINKDENFKLNIMDSMYEFYQLINKDITSDIFLDFLIWLNDNKMIDNHSFEYEKVIKKFIKQQKITN